MAQFQSLLFIYCEVCIQPKSAKYQEVVIRHLTDKFLRQLLCASMNRNFDIFFKEKSTLNLVVPKRTTLS